MTDGRFVLQAPIVFWCHLSSDQPSIGSRAFPAAGPKTWNTLSEDVTSSQSEYTFHRQLKGGFSRSLFRTSSCSSTFSLGFFVPTFLPFKVYDDMIMIYAMI